MDIDTAHASVLDESHGQEQKFDHATEKRARTLLGRRETIGSMLRKPEYAGAFRLKALADSFYEPLEHFLGDKEFLLDSSEPTFVDHLAYGYLNLMREPEMLQNWLSEIMRKKYPKIVGYLDRLVARADAKVGERTIEILFMGNKGQDQERPLAKNLPWTVAEQEETSDTVSYIWNDLLERLSLTDNVDESLARQKVFWERHLKAITAIFSGSMFMIGYWLHKEGLWPHGENIQIFGRKRLSDYGAAGATLAALGGLPRGG